MIGIERHFPESGSGVVSWVATFFRHLFGQMVSNCEKQEVDDDISTDTFRLETGRLYIPWKNLLGIIYKFGCS